MRMRTEARRYPKHVAGEDERLRRQSAVDPRHDAAPHPVFDRLTYREWDAGPGWDVNFLGVKTRVEFFSLYEQLADFSTARVVVGAPPVPNEDYFEWIVLLEAVVDARDAFTMVELGAGWGKWLAQGAAAVRQLNPLPFHLVGVESEPRHFAWMKQHLDDNGVSRGSRTLVKAAVAAHDGWVNFHVGAAADWYGQATEGEVEQLTPLERAKRLFRRGGGGDERRVELVRAVSLRKLLEPLDRVDLIDCDIQGAEADVLESAASVLDAKVRRVFIGTHNHEAEERLRSSFLAHGWLCDYDFPCESTNETPWGAILFEDGVQAWRNPRL